MKLIVVILSIVVAGCGADNKSSPGSSQLGGAIQGTSLSLTTDVSTLAGGTNGAIDGTGMDAQFYGPAGITTDGKNMYVSDSYNHTIRKIVLSTGLVTTIAGTTRISGWTDCAVGTLATFSLPLGITTDGINLYVADTGNHTIRKVVISTGAVTTFAGTPGVWGAMDCTVGIGATFDNPYGITTDGINLYVADTHNNAIRKIQISTSSVTTLAGGSIGSSDNTGILASFNDPVGLTTDGISLYVADAYNYTIRRITIATGVVTTLAGNAGHSGSTDDIGTAASFSLPFGVTTDGSNIYVTEGSGTIRKIAISTGEVTTLAGTAWILGFTNGRGDAASFDNPLGITTDGVALYIADNHNDAIRSIH